MNFIIFKNAVAQQFYRMQKHELYTMVPPAVSGQQPSAKDLMSEAYQNAFPQGTNEVFRKRPQHDCSCCKSFIRSIGNVVAIIDNKIVSTWDIDIPGEPTYNIVAAKMRKLIKGWQLGDLFRTDVNRAGTDFNFEDIDGNSHKWDHFYADIDPKFVMPADRIGPFCSEQRGNRDVFVRGLQTIEVGAIDTVIDLLANGSLYRGAEKESNLLKFKELVEHFDNLPEMDGEDILWATKQAQAIHPSLAKIRNTAMGKLLVAITNDEDLEDAVREYEKMMAPENYKRTTAVVTPAMKKKAQKFVEDNGLEPSLHRRHAMPTDITVANTLFANRKAKSLIEGSVFDALDVKASKPKMDKVEDVPIAQFLSKILPQAESLELYVETPHFGNLVSLTAPIYADAKPILQWDNNFCWSYRGEVTDSIKERVKAAGGVVDADLCCRLAWHNYDDLDLHMIEPDGNHIYFASRQSIRTGGTLDVDMNAGMGKTREPVENIFYKDRSKMKEGEYHLFVEQFNARETTNIGFEVDMEYLGQKWSFSHDKRVASRDKVTVVRFKYTKAQGIQILGGLPHAGRSSTEWSIESLNWHPVNMVMLSPNHWDDNRAGNKHWFFILDGCLNPEPVRGFYNEFLRQEFMEHRKTFEVLGTVTKAPFSEQQMSGLGFSSTQRNAILCKVSGKFNRVINIVF